jgi:thiamine pyrophosphokinase
MIQSDSSSRTGVQNKLTGKFGGRMFTLIFANGVLNHSSELVALEQQADLLLAVDGGANHCLRFGFTPDILLGDLDSIGPDILATYQKKNIAIYRHPTRKDATDLELALDLAREKGATTIWLVGALGGRWDMSLANIMLAAGEKYQDLEIFLLGEDCSMKILHPGKVHNISGESGQKISFLPLRGDVYGVTLVGFEYPLINHTIPFGASLGVSNILIANLATVEHSGGILLCVHFSDKNIR